MSKGLVLITASQRGNCSVTHTKAVNIALTKERLIHSSFYDLANVYQSVHINYWKRHVPNCKHGAVRGRRLVTASSIRLACDDIDVGCCASLTRCKIQGKYFKNHKAKYLYKRQGSYSSYFALCVIVSHPIWGFFFLLFLCFSNCTFIFF